MNTKKQLLVAILIAFAASQAFSQGAGRRLYPGASRARSNASAPISRKLAYPWTITFGLGYASEFGQLKSFGAGFGPTDPQFNLGIRYRYTTRFTLAASARIFSLSGDDSKAPAESGRQTRGIIQTTSCKEIQLIGMYDIIPIITRFMGDKTDQYNRRNVFVPYVFGGVGLLLFDPQFKNPTTGKSESVSGLRLSQDASGNVINGFSTITPTLSLGLGFRVKITEFFDLGADLSYTSTFTDYLDGLSKGSYYYDYTKVSNITANEMVLSDPNSYASFNNPNINDPSYISLRNPEGDPTNGLGIKANNNGSGKDGYFILNVRVDYTLSSLKNIGKQKAHRHFSKGKGTYHHKFQRK